VVASNGHTCRSAALGAMRRLIKRRNVQGASKQGL
jgi:hypothetical protein